MWQRFVVIVTDDLKIKNSKFHNLKSFKALRKKSVPSFERKEANKKNEESKIKKNVIIISFLFKFIIDIRY